MSGADQWAEPVQAVAGQAVTTYGQVAPGVQITIAIGVTLVALSMVWAWWARGSKISAGVSPQVLVAVTEEVGAQIVVLRESVETLTGTVSEMRETITGCQTCPWHPNQGGK